MVQEVCDVLDGGVDRHLHTAIRLCVMPGQRQSTRCTLASVRRPGIDVGGAVHLVLHESSAFIDV